MGHVYGRTDAGGGWGGAVTGFTKTYKREKAEATVKVVDFEADCKATFDKFGVPEAEQEELFAIIGSTKGDIVVAD